MKVSLTQFVLEISKTMLIIIKKIEYYSDWFISIYEQSKRWKCIKEIAVNSEFQSRRNATHR